MTLEALWSLREGSVSINAPSINGDYLYCIIVFSSVPHFLSLQKEVAIKAISDPNSEEGKVQRQKKNQTEN